MYSVMVCVVLAIFGNASSFVLRTRRDLEQTILDVYGLPSVTREMHHHPHQMPPSKSDYTATREFVDRRRRPHHLPSFEPDHETSRPDVEKPKVYIPQEVLDDIFGSPLKKTKPDSGSSAPKFYSAISDDVRNTKQKGAEDLPKRDATNVNDGEEPPMLSKDILNIFGPPTAPEAMAATENSTASNKTEKFDSEDRFLSESFLRNQWNNNREDGKEDTVKPELQERKQPIPFGLDEKRTLLKLGPIEHRQTSLPLEPVSPDPVSLDINPTPLHPRSLDSTPSGSSLERKQHIPIATSSTNASSKHFPSKFLVLMLIYFCLESLVLI